MNIQVWLLRAKRWARNPPSARTVMLVLGLIAVCLLIAYLESVFGLPDWLTVNRLSGKP
jgi:hypothetical protein